MRPPSNISLLENDFRDMIVDVRPGQDGTGYPQSRMITRHTFIFVDGSRLYITEQCSGGFIEVSHYNWVDDKGADILKFHSEPHDGHRWFQTDSEPHHVHPPVEAKLTNRTRYSNFHHQELPAILEHIFFSLVAAKKM